MNNVGTDKIWKANKVVLPRDFYKNFSDVSIYTRTGVYNVINTLDFDLTDEMLELMPLLPEHIFDFSVTWMHELVWDFYIAATYENDTYSLVIPHEILFHQNTIVVTKYDNISDPRPSITLNFHPLYEGDKFSWLEFLEIYKDQITITINPKWTGIDKYLDITLEDNIPQDTLVHVNNFQATDKLTIGDESLTFRNGVAKVPITKDSIYETYSDDRMYKVLYFRETVDTDKLSTQNSEDNKITLYQFVLPDKITSKSGFSIGSVYSYFDLETFDYVIPYFKYDFEGFTVDYKHSDVSAGIAFDIAYTTPLTQYLRGEMRILWAQTQPAVVSEHVIKVEEIEANNAMTLYDSAIPIIYRPRDFGEITIDDVDYWFIDWGFSPEFSPDSEEFDKLSYNQPFELKDNAFLNSYELKKAVSNAMGSDSWTGNNFCINAKLRLDYLQEENDNDSVYVYEKFDDRAKELWRFWGHDPDAVSLINFMNDPNVDESFTFTYTSTTSDHSYVVKLKPNNISHGTTILDVDGSGVPYNYIRFFNFDNIPQDYKTEGYITLSFTIPTSYGDFTPEYVFDSDLMGDLNPCVVYSSNIGMMLLSTRGCKYYILNYGYEYKGWLGDLNQGLTLYIRKQLFWRENTVIHLHI